MATKKIFYGKDAIREVEKKEGRKLSYAERRVVEEEGYVPALYKDNKGITTFGVGQTGKYIDKSFDETFQDHVKRAKKRIKNFDTLPEEMQAELVQAEYRGDLGQSPKFVRLFNEGKFTEAAKEFTDNDDFRTSVKDKTGVAGRMRKVAASVTGLSTPAQVEDFGGLVNAKPEALPSPNEKPMEFPNNKATLPLGLEASDTGAIKSLQKSIGVKQDGDWGPKSQTAYDMMFNGRNQFAQTDPRRTDLTPSNGTIPVREYAQDMRSQPRTEALNPIRNSAAEDMTQQGMGRARIVEPIRPLERTYDFNTMEDLLMSKGLMPNPLL